MHFELEICFAPQPRAICGHPTSKSAPNLMCFGHFDLQMRFVPQWHVLIWPDGPAPAALAGLLFRPSPPTNQWKNTMFRDFPNISRACIFVSSESFSLLLFSLFSCLLSGSSHLCFSSLHFVGSLTSKLPLMIDCKLLLIRWQSLRMKGLSTPKCESVKFVWAELCRLSSLFIFAGLP